MAAELGIGKEALDAFAKEGEDAAAAVEELSEAIDIYLGQQFNVSEATRQAGESFAEMIDKFTDGEATWADQAAAQQEYVTGVAGMVTAMSEQGESQQAVDNALRSNISSLRAARDAGQITGEQFVTLRDQILGIPHGTETRVLTPGAREAQENMRLLKMGIELVPGRKAVPVSAPGATEATSQAWGFKNALDAIPKEVVVHYKNVGAPLAKYASGTESAAPGLAMVGERGPELVAFSGGERVFTASQSRAMVSSGSSAAGAGIVVNVYGKATAADAQPVVDALRRWSQRNGPVPIKVNG
jgi:hypothetical protein